MKNRTKIINNCLKWKKDLCFYSCGEKKEAKKKKEGVLLYNCIQTLLSDPIVVLYTNDHYICTGTLTGKVCLYRITTKKHKAVNTDITYSDKQDEEKCTTKIELINSSKTELEQLKSKDEFNNKDDYISIDSYTDFNNTEVSKINNSKQSMQDKTNNNIIINIKKQGKKKDVSDNVTNDTYHEVVNNSRHDIAEESIDNSPKKYVILCMFRNNNIQSIYIDTNYVYVYHENCIDIFNVKTYEFINTINIETINNKQVINFEHFILFNNSKNLFIYDIKNNFTSYFYKNFLKNIIIFDFNANYLLCYKSSFGKCHIRVIKIYINCQTSKHELIFCVDFSSTFISHGKFLDDEKIIVAKNGKRLIIFDFKKAIDMYRIKKLKKIILDIYKSLENMLFILVENQIFSFNLSTFIFYKCIKLPTGLFYFKWPYYIRHKNNKIIFSSDKGVYLIDFPIEETV
ncbi:conserved protein, unknown function [Hepatocystis sp. ex Piliocolobus tephrosceles]|nr:conserved protein, unknown function [Hepatocystis sp. ex Piliocolobus tephrosceles]